MATSVSLHRIDFSKTEVDKLDSSWVIRFYDDERNNVTLFIDRAEEIYELSKHIVSLTVDVLSNPVNQTTVNKVTNKFGMIMIDDIVVEKV